MRCRECGQQPPDFLLLKGEEALRFSNLLDKLGRRLCSGGKAGEEFCGYSVHTLQENGNRVLYNLGCKEIAKQANSRDVSTLQDKVGNSAGGMQHSLEKIHLMFADEINGRIFSPGGKA